MRKENSTVVTKLVCMKRNNDTVASKAYMIYDRDYYSIIDKENRLSLLDNIYQKIIW